jgi:phage virion morphogenesis protein
MDFQIKIDDSQVTATMNRLRGRISALGPVMAGIATELESQAQEAFRREGPDWKSLEKSTLRQRAKQGHADSPILNISGGRGLLGSLMSHSTATTATVGAGSGKSAKYAAIHQFGGMAGRGRKVAIPARPYLPVKRAGDDFSLTDQATARLMRMLRDFVERG